jgi:hypothetical protein
MNMAVEQKVTTTPFFDQTGTLRPAGVIVNIDTDKMDISTDEKGRSNTPNLAEPGEAPVLLPTEVAAIGPTGPAPTMPQQVPPGSMQMTDGYANGEALLVAQGRPGFAEMQASAEEQNEGVEEEAVMRLSATEQTAGTAGAGDAEFGTQNGTNGTETGSTGRGEPFNAETFIGRTLDEISDDEIAALSDEDRAAAIAAEQDREKPRVGLLRALGVEE